MSSFEFPSRGLSMPEPAGAVAPLVVPTPSPQAVTAALGGESLQQPGSPDDEWRTLWPPAPYPSPPTVEATTRIPRPALELQPPSTPVPETAPSIHRPAQLLEPSVVPGDGVGRLPAPELGTETQASMAPDDGVGRLWARDLLTPTRRVATELEPPITS